MNAPNADYDAAEALLALQGTWKQESPRPYMWRAVDSSEDTEKTAKLVLNCFMSPNALSTPNCQQFIAKVQPKPTTEYTKVLSPFQGYGNNKPKNRLLPKINDPTYYKTCDSKGFKSVNAPINTVTSQKLSVFESVECGNFNHIAQKTRNVATQTDESLNPNIEFMENTIKTLCLRIKSLEAQLKQPNTPNQSSSFVSSENEDMNNQSYVCHQDIDGDKSLIQNTFKEAKRVQYLNYSKNLRFQNSDENIVNNGQHKSKELLNHKVIISNYNSHAKDSDLVPIGGGNAAVPTRLLKHINWNSYTNATRKLLTAVFSRRILATHSLTGKPSPAFPNKPAKKKLDAALVNDIVQTVVERCSVPENVVRTSITTKCADESKMFKTRQKNRNKRTSKKNRENTPLSTSESESEDY